MVFLTLLTEGARVLPLGHQVRRCAALFSPNTWPLSSMLALPITVWQVRWDRPECLLTVLSPGFAHQHE
jgi:hypothetical protein